MADVSNKLARYLKCGFQGDEDAGHRYAIIIIIIIVAVFSA